MKSIIFDLDGTLWNACDTICEAWNTRLSQLGVGKTLVPADFYGGMGLLIDDIARLLLPELEPEEAGRIARDCARFECGPLREKGGRLYPGVEETIRELARGYKLLIVSNCGHGYIESFFAAHGLGKYFLDYEYAERTGRSKGENIRLIAERNGLSSPVYVGDTAGDMAAAGAAGVDFIHAAYGFGEAPGAGIHISSPRELLDIFTERGVG